MSSLGGSSGGRGGGQVFIAGMVTNFIGKGTSSFELLLKKGREKTFFHFAINRATLKYIFFSSFIFFFINLQYCTLHYRVKTIKACVV